MDSSDAIRHSLWHQVFSKTPSQGLEGTTLEERRKFIERSLELFRKIDFDPDPSLVDDVVNIVRFDKGTWPLNEPEKTIHTLVENVLKQGESPSEVKAEHTLQLLLFAFDGRYASEGAHLHGEQQFLVDILLKHIGRDIDVCRRGDSPRALRLAILLAANYTAIHSLEQRYALIELLKTLVECNPICNDPFIEDLLIIHKRMGLKELEALHERRKEG
jgi:hypothetical protein